MPYLYSTSYSVSNRPSNEKRFLLKNVFNLTTIDILSQIILRCGELPGAFQDIQQYPWPVPIRCQQHLPFPASETVTLKNVSRYCQVSPRGQNHCWRTTAPSLRVITQGNEAFHLQYSTATAIFKITSDLQVAVVILGPQYVDLSAAFIS